MARVPVMGPPHRRLRRKERGTPEQEDPPEVAKAITASAEEEVHPNEYKWDAILRNLSLDERRADPQGIGRPWTPGPPLPRTLTRDVYSGVPLMSNGIFLPGNRFLECPPTAGPPTIRRCIASFSSSLFARRPCCCLSRALFRRSPCQPGRRSCTAHALE